MHISSKEGPRGSSLALFLTGSLRIDSKTQLEEFLDQPNARGLVRSAPYQDVFLAIKTVGLADCLELLQLTTPSQRRGFIDLDCWRKDNFHLPSFMEWMVAFIQCGPEEPARMARAVDPNVLGLFLKDNIEVYALELDEPPPDLPLTLTPDRSLGVQVTSEGEGATISRLILDAIFRFDPSLGYDLIDRVRWENRLSMEEEAYQNKRRRLEEIGFVDYYEALEIYGEIDTALPAGKPPVVAREETFADTSTTLPALLVASLTPGHYLLEALQAINDKQQVEKIRQALAALANRILSVHTVTPGDLEKVRPALEEIRDTLSIPLEHLAQGEIARATEVLRHTDVQSLFRVGFNLIAALRNEAERIVGLGGLRLVGCRETLLETPDEEFFNGVRRLRPLFFQGLDDPSISCYRNFQSLRDIDTARQRLRDLTALGSGFWKLFPDGAAREALTQLQGGNLRSHELRFSHIFNTACVNMAMRAGFQPRPLVPSILPAFLNQAGRQGRNELFGILQLQARERLTSQVLEPFEKLVLERYASVWLQRLCDELTPLKHAQHVEPRLIRSLLLCQEPPARPKA